MNLELECHSQVVKILLHACGNCASPLTKQNFPFGNDWRVGLALSFNLLELVAREMSSNPGGGKKNFLECPPRLPHNSSVITTTVPDYY